MSRILCFCWSNNDTSLDEINHRKCLDSLFIGAIKIHLLKYRPNIIVITSDGNQKSTNFFHTHFLPNKMTNLGYKSLIIDSYENLNSTSEELSMSIYTLLTDKSISVIEATKILVSNENKYSHTKILNNQPKGMSFYLKTPDGVFAFITVQMKNGDKGLCMKSIEEKLIRENFLNYAFLMGKFSGDQIYHNTLNGYDVKYLEYLTIFNEHDRMGIMGIYEIV